MKQFSSFSAFISHVNSAYSYTPRSFSIGDEETGTLNGAGENEGSLKVVAYAKLYGLSTSEALELFGEHYQEVLDDPDGDSHGNIRALKKHGLLSVQIDGVALVGNSPYFAFAIGVGTQNAQGEWLEVFYSQPIINPNPELTDAAKVVGYKGGNEAIELDETQRLALYEALGEDDQADLAESIVNSTSPVVLTVLANDAEPSSTPEAYLKLHLLSHRLVKPLDINLDGIFPLLPNVAWTNQGAVDLDELMQRQLEARAKGELISVNSVDKFPKMSDYVVPSGVRIAHTARVRLGAYLGEGTTVMHEGFVNFNAGTEGNSMIEGRISNKVFVGKGSDLGGGCSTMGTLSGGNDVIISIGDKCLIGANAGVGIPLGDRCTIEAGLYVTAGTKVIMLDNEGKEVKKVKARDLAYKPDLLFRRNSISGAVECLTNQSVIELNEELHAHN